MERDDSPSDVEKIISRNKIWLYVSRGGSRIFEKGVHLILRSTKKGGLQEGAQLWAHC